MQTPRILITDKATELIEKLRKINGPLMFHQSGGCCDGSTPMCFADGDFKIGNSDVCLGTVAGCKFTWRQTSLNIGNIHSSRWM